MFTRQPNPSIDEYESLEAYINAFFKKRAAKEGGEILPHETYDYYLKMKTMKIAGKPLSKPQRAKEQGISKQTLYNWDKHYAKEHPDEEDSNTI